MLNQKQSALSHLEVTNTAISAESTGYKKKEFKPGLAYAGFFRTLFIIFLFVVIDSQQKLYAQCSPDITPPTITCTSNISVTANAGECSAVVNYGLTMVTDNCNGCASAPAIAGYTSLGVNGGFAYYISNSTMSATAAFTAAAAQGGQVATIKSAAENSFVRTAANGAGFTGNYFIGINDVSVEGTFVGGSGEAIIYTNWNSGEPNNSGNEDYVQVYSTGLWNDIGTGATGNFILKKSCITPVRTTGLASGSAFPVGTTTVTYSATDASGNSSNCSFNVTVSLNPISIGKTVSATPTSVCAGNSSNINIALSENGISYQLRDNATNANIGSPVTGTGGTISLSTGALSSATTFNILATNPLNSCSYQLTNTATVNVSALPVVTAPSSVCIGSTATLSPTSGGTWVSSNNTLATVTNAGVITGVATGSPTFTFTQTSTGCSKTTSSVTVNPLPNNVSATATSSTICSGSSTNIVIAGSQSGVDYQLRNNSGNTLIGSPVAGTGGSINLPTGNLTATTTFNVLATSVAGCSRQLTSLVTVSMDNIAPVITCPGNKTLNLDGSCNAVMPDYTTQVTVSDNCTATGSIVLTQSPSAGSSLSTPGNITVTITATDASGNASNCTFTLTKADVTGPVISCPANITVNADPASCGAIVSYTISATDNCSSFCSPSSIAGYTSLGTFNGHTYFRSNSSTNWATANSNALALGAHLVTITSAAENTFLSSAGVSWTNLSDEGHEGTWLWLNGEPVTYTNWNPGEPNNSGGENYMHVNYSVAGGWNDIGATGSYPAIIEFDCVSTTLISGYASGSLFPVGTTTVSYTATDISGNSNNCSFTVTVNDVTAPTISCPANMSVHANAGECTAVVNYNLPIVSDNCSACTSAPAIAGYTSLGVYNGFAYYISATTMTPVAAFTAAGSLGGQVATINSAAENSFVRNAANTAGYTGNYIIGTNDVAIEGTFVGGSGETISYFNWNSGEPNNSGNEDYVQVYASGVWNDIGAGSAGNYILKKSCITPVLTGGLASGAAFPLGTTTVTYSGTDAAGNSSSCAFTVTVSLNPTSISKTVTASPATVCSGSSSNINIALSENGISYQLRDNATNANIGSPVIGNGGTISLPTGALITATTFNILATNTGNGCSYQLTNTVTVTINALPTVTSPASVCVGSTATLSPSTGGTWTSSNNAVATVTNAGVITGVAPSTATFTFTQTSTGCSRTTSSVTINALPTVTSPASVCVGSTVTLSPTTGGTWASSNNAVATVTNGGVITGVASGTATFTFTQTSTGCIKTTSSVTVNALPTVSITGSSSVCVGFTTTLSPATGGTWASSDNSIATVTNGGVVTGVAGGTATFTFTQTSTGCSRTTSSVTINALPTVTSSASVCVGSTATLSPTSGGTWTSSNNAVATVTNGGVITGVASGTATFTFTQTSTGCSKTTSSVTVNALPTVSITGSSSVCVGSTTILSPATGGTWASSDNSIATVTNGGVVTGVAAGTATFTFTQTSTGCSRTTSSVTVKALPTVTSPASVCVGSTATLSPTTGGTWTSSNNAVATVTNGGVVTGVASGSATFTFTLTSTGCSRTTSAVTVNINSTIILSSAVGTNNQAACVNTPITNITYNIGGGGTGASVSGLPSGVNGSFSSGVYTISGTPAVNGTFNYTVTTTGPCTNPSANGTITISAATVAGTVNDDVICFGGSGTLNLTGNTGNVIRWERSTDGGSTWTNISNTTTSLSYSGISTTTHYRALVQNSSCGAQLYTNNAKVAIHNLWTGSVSSDWNTAANWSDGLLPTNSCPEVTIPVLALPNVYPQITSGTASVNNLVIYPSATMSVSNVTLQVAGSITNNGTLDITNGTLELNGTSAAQSISGSLFFNHQIKNIIISNSNGVSLSGTNDTLKISGRVGFGTNNAVLTTNGNLTLVSNASGTAYVADLTNNGLNSGNDIIGKVTAERYIPSHPKAWQFLAVPTKGATIREAWQETNSNLASNVHTGYGTIITSNIAGAVGLGFDIYTPAGPSMKTYNPTTNGWDGVASTSMQIANPKGYMFFVRGDRTVTTSSAPATAVTLRTSGQLYTSGSNAPASITVPAGKFESVGNPYASAIDFRKLTKSAAPDVADIFYVWDPLLTNTYFGLGGYQTISAANGWKPIPGGTANYNASTPNPYIQSGQAFMVRSSGSAGSISFSETSKIDPQSSTFRPTDAPDEKQFFRASMTNAADVMSDGNVVTFDNAYTNDYDETDATKIANSSENFGIRRFGTLLALEARHTVQAADTIFYNLGNMRVGDYKLKFAPVNMENTNLVATLVDKHLASTTNISLSDSTMVPFSVTAAAAGSYAADRFYVVFNPLVVLPVTITKIEAFRNRNSSVTVNWNSVTEINLSKYEVERSNDGRNFVSIDRQLPKVNNGSNASYSMIDNGPLAGDNFYRIKATGIDHKIQYSAIVRVAGAVMESSIDIYPNPVVDKRINVHFRNAETGSYNAQIINAIGQTVYNTVLKITSSNSVESIETGKDLAAGKYQLKLISGDGKVIVRQLIIQ